MHGVVMSGLQSFIRDQEGNDTWREVRNRAGVDRTIYSRMEEYPDEEFLAIYGVLVDDFGMDGPALQREFGRYLFESLADLYERIYFDDDWDALDMIENVEETIHESLRRRDDVTFTPPELATDRIGDHRVVVIYTSDRYLCELAWGMIEGVGDYYGTPLEIDEASCLKDGDETCRLVVTDATEVGSSEDVPETDAASQEV